MSPARVPRALSNTVDVVEFLASHPDSTTAEITEATGLPRTNVYRIVDGLVEAGLATLLDDRRVSLSRRWLHLADATLSGMTEWGNSSHVLDDLANSTGQTAYLIVPRGRRAVCVAWSPGRGIGVLETKPGRSLPLYAGAAGRLALAYAVEDLDAYLADAPFAPLTPRTLIDSGALRDDVENTRREGRVVSDEDATTGIVSLGLPLFDASRRFAGSVSLGGLREEVLEHEDEYFERLGSAADSLSS